MARDEFGMPLGYRRLLPISLNDDGEAVDRDGDEIELLYDSDFFIHAANNIIPAREIVRRLATSKSVSDLLEIAADAEKLWEKMQKEAGDERLGVDRGG